MLKNEIAQFEEALPFTCRSRYFNVHAFFGASGWKTHRVDLIGRLDAINAMISLAQKWGVMSREKSSWLLAFIFQMDRNENSNRPQRSL
jgi:hypothetical protein